MPARRRLAGLAAAAGVLGAGPAVARLASTISPSAATKAARRAVTRRSGSGRRPSTSSTWRVCCGSSARTRSASSTSIEPSRTGTSSSRASLSRPRPTAAAGRLPAPRAGPGPAARDRGRIRARRAAARVLLGDDPGLEVRGAGFFEAARGAADADAGTRRADRAARAHRGAARAGVPRAARRRGRARARRPRTRWRRGGRDALSADRYPELRSPTPGASRTRWRRGSRSPCSRTRGRSRRGRSHAAGRSCRSSPGEDDRLREVSADLRERMARLAASRREDWGYPLLLGMARLAALETSLRSQRLALLDAYPAQSGPSRSPRRVAPHLADLLAEAGADLAAAARAPADAQRLARSGLERPRSRGRALARAARGRGRRGFDPGAGGGAASRRRARVSLAWLPRPAARLGRSRTDTGRRQPLPRAPRRSLRVRPGAPELRVGDLPHARGRARAAARRRRR